GRQSSIRCCKTRDWTPGRRMVRLCPWRTLTSAGESWNLGNNSCSACKRVTPDSRSCIGPWECCSSEKDCLRKRRRSTRKNSKSREMSWLKSNRWPWRKCECAVFVQVYWSIPPKRDPSNEGERPSSPPKEALTSRHLHRGPPPKALPIDAPVRPAGSASVERVAKGGNRSTPVDSLP